MTRSPLARLSLAGVTAALLVGLTVLANQAPQAGGAMVAAADTFLGTLPPELKAKAAQPFDSPNREQWFFTPQQTRDKQPLRKGVRLDELDAKQKAAALDLLRAGLSGKGFDQATTIMSLENILAELEKNGANAREPGWYFVSVFGAPSATGNWGWRVEGHHLSVNLTLDGGRVVAASPVVFGANPAEVRSGPRKGLRTLPEVEDLARELIASLTPEQRAEAKQPKPLPEIAENTPAAKPGEPVGLAAGRMTEEQRATVWKLLAAYANRLPAEVAAAELKRVQEADVKRVKFAYHIAEDKPGKPTTYRLHGPAAVVEFLNAQADGAGNPANHIHSGWRRLPGDFGR
jgi:hypothetical protein